MIARSFEHPVMKIEPSNYFYSFTEHIYPKDSANVSEY